MIGAGGWWQGGAAARIAVIMSRYARRRLHDLWAAAAVSPLR
ncbi:hypothetical protein [Microbacterium sp. K21]|nr:hypothetical protein [Microbacterium sp. K21]